MTQVKLRNGGSFAALGGSGTRGPDGVRRPPGTGAYDRPATATATAATLQTAINNATSGAVIELTTDLTGTVTLTGPVGASTWAENVLVRPPLGQRRSCGKVIIACPRLTVAGLDVRLANGMTAEDACAVRAPRAAFWRMVDVDCGVQWQIDAVDGTTAGDGAALCEVAAPYAYYNGQADRCQLKPHSTAGAIIKNPLVDGCYFNHKIRGTATGGTKIDWTVAGPLAVANTVATFTASATYDPVAAGKSVAILAWLTTPPVGQPVIVRVKKNGVVQQTLTLDGTPDYEFGVVDSITTISWVATDVITLDVVQVGTTTAGAGLRVLIGDTSEGHCDQIQFIASGGVGAAIQDPILRDTVLGAASSGGIQLANVRGEMIVDNLFINSASGAYSARLGHTGSTLGSCRYYVSRNRFNGTPAIGSARPMVFKHNQAVAYNGGFDGSAVFPYDATNQTGVTRGAQDPVPDLAAVWPDCPFTV